MKEGVAGKKAYTEMMTAKVNRELIAIGATAKAILSATRTAGDSAARAIIGLNAQINKQLFETYFLHAYSNMREHNRLWHSIMEPCTALWRAGPGHLSAWR